MLEEVQMPVLLRRGVVDGMLPGRLRIRKPSARDNVHGDRQRTGLGIKGHVPHEPGCLNPQGRLEQLRLRHRQDSLIQSFGSVLSMINTHTEFNRG